MKAWAAAAVLGTLIAGTAQAQSVGGAYTVAGVNPDGSRYSGTAQISQGRGGTCQIVWKTGPTTSEGVCMLANKAFAAFYKLGPDFGLIVYELQPNGALKGYWTLVDKNVAGQEVLTPR